jgi:glycosyltransferase involved in cell wall biosynthesis
MNDIISFIIPTYNRAHFLPEAIQSVLDQTAVNWNLIIVDDGSTDDTKKVVERYLRDPRISYSYQNNYGVSVARNKGIDLSIGDYLIFLDSDDQFFPELLTKLNEIKYRNYDLICWQVIKKVTGKSSVLKPRKLEKIYNNITAIFLSGSICYRKKILLEAGGFDPKMTFGENYELGMRVTEIADLKMKIINTPLIKYRIPQDRVSNSVENRLNSYLHLYQKHKIKFLQDKVSNSQMNYLLGYVHEKQGNLDEARIFYKNSLKSSYRNYKAILKFIYFNIFR